MAAVMVARKVARKVAKGPWALPSDAPKSGTDWPFVAPDDVGLDWFAVSLPPTAYGHPSIELGRAYAFELIDGLRNPDGELGPVHMGIVFAAIGRWSKNCTHPCMGSFLQGLGAVLGEYIQTHNANR